MKERLVKTFGGITQEEMEDVKRSLSKEMQEKIDTAELNSSRHTQVLIREAADNWSQIAMSLGMDLNIGGTIYSKQGLIETSGTTQQATQSELYDCWDKNALGSTIVDYYSIYPLGDGPSWNIAWDEVEDCINKVWEYNDLNHKVYKWASELSLNGDLFVRLFAAEEDGEVVIKVRSIDPSTIVRVITDPEDADSPIYYHQRYFISITPDVLLPPEGELPTVDWISKIDGYKNVIDFELADEQGRTIVPGVSGQPGGVQSYDPQSGFYAFITRKIPAQEMLHTKVNCLDWETRGRSDLFRVVRWIREYVSVLQSMAQISKMATLYLWDVEVEGGDKSVQATINNNLVPPPPGSIKIHSNLEKWNFLTPEIHAQDHAAVISSILNMIAGGTKLASFMLGNSGDTSFAGSNTQFMPVVKSFKLRQQILLGLFKELFSRIVKIHQFYGALPETVDEIGDDNQPTGKQVDPSNSDFGLRLPDVAEIDFLEKSTALTSLKTAGLISDQAAQENLGLNPEEQRAELASENEYKTDQNIEKTKKMQDAGVMPNMDQGDPGVPKPNLVRQKGAEPPQPKPNVGGSGRDYPNHQRNNDSSMPRRGSGE